MFLLIWILYDPIDLSRTSTQVIGLPMRQLNMQEHICLIQGIIIKLKVFNTESK